MHLCYHVDNKNKFTTSDLGTQKEKQCFASTGSSEEREFFEFITEIIKAAAEHDKKISFFNTPDQAINELDANYEVYLKKITKNNLGFFFKGGDNKEHKLNYDLNLDNILADDTRLIKKVLEKIEAGTQYRLDEYHENVNLPLSNFNKLEFTQTFNAYSAFVVNPTNGEFYLKHCYEGSSCIYTKKENGVYVPFSDTANATRNSQITPENLAQIILEIAQQTEKLEINSINGSTIQDTRLFENDLTLTLAEDIITDDYYAIEEKNNNEIVKIATIDDVLEMIQNSNTFEAKIYKAGDTLTLEEAEESEDFNFDMCSEINFEINMQGNNFKVCKNENGCYIEVELSGSQRFTTKTYNDEYVTTNNSDGTQTSTFLSGKTEEEWKNLLLEKALLIAKQVGYLNIYYGPSYTESLPKNSIFVKINQQLVIGTVSVQSANNDTIELATKQQIASLKNRIEALENAN